MAQVQPARRSLVPRLLFSLALLIAALVIFVNRQAVIDNVRYATYKPNSSIVTITDRMALTERGKFLFYASVPSLLPRESFNNSCRSSGTEQTAVLGCYSAQQIYLFDINNQKLDGIKEVTGAHEMLHAAYDRLSETERARVDALIEKQDFGGDTERIEALMADYAVSEPGERNNELHSILATEVAILSPELETYYKTYFTDRSRVVALMKQYQGVFDELKTRQSALADEINQLADTIDVRSKSYSRDQQVLNSDVESFNRQASSGSMSREAYESERTRLETRQRALRTAYSEIQDLIYQYEQKRAELSAINTESNALNRSINSSLSPVPEI